MGVQTYRLVGWVRFRRGEDDSGVPVFSVGANSLFVPETDDDLVIIRFHKFYNEQNFDVDYRLPSSFDRRIYVEGDQAPIPFCVAGQPAVVQAGTSPSEFLVSFEGQTASRSVQHVAGILHRQAARKSVPVEIEQNVIAKNESLVVQSRYPTTDFEHSMDSAFEADEEVEGLDVNGRRYLLPLEAHRRIEWQESSGSPIRRDEAVLIWCGEIVLWTSEGGVNGPLTPSFEEAAAWTIEEARKRPPEDVFILQLLSYRCPVTYVERIMSEQSAAYDMLSKFWIAAVQPYSTEAFWRSDSGESLPTYPPVNQLIEKLRHLKDYGPEESATALLSRAKNVWYGSVSDDDGNRNWSTSNQDEEPPF